jgi:hypothetical protein
LMLPKTRIRDTVFLASEVSSDFESLHLQSRAALDRLTNFISMHYGNDTDRFSRLRKVLQNSKKEEKDRLYSYRH